MKVIPPTAPNTLQEAEIQYYPPSNQLALEPQAQRTLQRGGVKAAARERPELPPALPPQMVPSQSSPIDKGKDSPPEEHPEDNHLTSEETLTHTMSQLSEHLKTDRLHVRAWTNQSSSQEPAVHEVHHITVPINRQPEYRDLHPRDPEQELPKPKRMKCKSSPTSDDLHLSMEDLFEQLSPESSRPTKEQHPDVPHQVETPPQGPSPEHTQPLPGPDWTNLLRSNFNPEATVSLAWSLHRMGRTLRTARQAKILAARDLLSDLATTLTKWVVEPQAFNQVQLDSYLLPNLITALQELLLLSHSKPGE